MSEGLLDRMRDAIAGVLAEDGESPETAAGIVTGYVVVVECYGSDGHTWSSLYSGTEHTARTLGLLRWADMQIHIRDSRESE